MEFYTDIEKARPLVEESIRKFGHVAEHNFEYYRNWSAGYGERVFAQFLDDEGLLTFRDKGTWEIFAEPLAHAERKVPILFEFFVHAFAEPKIKKIKIELREDTRKNLLRALPPNMRARHITYTLTAPVFDLTSFNPTLPGGHYKDLRNARSAFYRDHAVEMVDAQTADKRTLHGIVDAWKKNRPPRDRAYPGLFHAYIDDNFSGTTSARAFNVDGRIVGVNAGWAIVNSPGAYYGAIGLHDYSLRDLGDIMYLEDLAFLKEKGYRYADFGGSWKKAISYKLKFGQANIYKSFIFSVVRK